MMTGQDTNDDDIAKEERWIRIYRAQLAKTQLNILATETTMIQQKTVSNEPFRLPEQSWHNASTDPLDWILEIQPKQLNTTSLIESIDQQEQDVQKHASVHRIQPNLRSFCFVNVQLLHSVEHNQRTTASYQLDGFFTTKPTVQAKIQLQLELDRNDHSQTKLTKLDCRVITDSNSRDLSWIPRNDSTLNLPAWLDSVRKFLEFEQQRTQFLQQHKITEYSIDRHQTTLKLPIDNNNDDTDISLLWTWKWKEQRDVIRLRSVSSTVRQEEIEYLVKATGSCRTALECLLPQQPQHHSDQHDENTNHSMDADDEGSVEYPSPPKDKHAFSPNGRRRSPYEIQRLQRIERNQEYLASLGLVELSHEKKKRVAATVKSEKRKGHVLPKKQRLYREAKPNSLHDNDAYLQPKTAPLEHSDGTFVRPRGRAPVGYDWDMDRGMWVRDMIGANNDKSFNNTMNTDDCSSRTIKSSDIQNHRIALHHHSLQKKKGPFPRSGGRSKEGQQCNTLRGVWEQSTSSNDNFSLKRAPLLESKSPLVKLGDGTFKRPSGIGPEGYMWDERRGVWQLQTQTEEENISQKNSSESTSSAYDQYIIPDFAPIQDADGRYVKPVEEMPPPGYEWDTLRGVWQPAGIDVVSERTGKGTWGDSLVTSPSGRRYSIPQVITTTASSEVQEDSPI